jgi:hypothetical protein
MWGGGPSGGCWSISAPGMAPISLWRRGTSHPRSGARAAAGLLPRCRCPSGCFAVGRVGWRWIGISTRPSICVLWAGRPERPYREFPGKSRLWRSLWRRNGPRGPVYEPWVDEAGSGPSFISPRAGEMNDDAPRNGLWMFGGLAFLALAAQWLRARGIAGPGLEEGLAAFYLVALGIIGFGVLFFLVPQLPSIRKPGGGPPADPPAPHDLPARAGRLAAPGGGMRFARAG